MPELVIYRRDDHVATITLNRPEKLNALSLAMLDELFAKVDEFIADRDARVAVLRGAGRAFCVGMDIPQLVATSGASTSERGGSEASSIEHGRRTPTSAAVDRAGIEAVSRRYLRLFECPKPVIAQVHGHCFGAGTQLPICCDLVTIADDAVLGWPRLPVGAGWVSPMWSFRIGVQRAKAMSFRSGSTMTGSEAYELGYAAKVFPADTLEQETLRIAQEIAKVPSDLLRIEKAALNRVLERQGFREAVLAGAEWDALAHTTETVQRSHKWINELGIRGAIEKFATEGM